MLGSQGIAFFSVRWIIIGTGKGQQVRGEGGVIQKALRDENPGTPSRALLLSFLFFDRAVRRFTERLKARYMSVFISCFMERLLHLQVARARYGRETRAGSAR